MLIDLSLPNGSGLHLIEALRAQQPDLKCLVVSGYEKAAYGELALAAGARGYVVKGNIVTLLDAIHVVMAGEIYEDSG